MFRIELIVRGDAAPILERYDECLADFESSGDRLTLFAWPEANEELMRRLELDDDVQFVQPKNW